MKKFLLTIVGAGLLVAGFQANAQVLLATTNEGELVEIDLLAGTATLIGDAGRLPGKSKDAGWTGLSFDVAGKLIVVSKQSSEPSALDAVCTVSPGDPSKPKKTCAHLYEVNPSNGAVILPEIGSLEMPFVSDIDFASGITLFGSQWDSRGALVTVDPVTASALIVGPFGTIDNGAGGSVELQNGGLSVHPISGEIWAVETGFGPGGGVGEPQLFKVAPNGMFISPEIPLGMAGSPLSFGFDALEILPDGRFIATRGEGRSEVYEINPVPDAGGFAEVTLIPLSLDPGIAGGLNGLEFLRASPDPLDTLTNDIIDLDLRRGVTRTLTRTLDRVKRRLSRGRLASARDGICVFIEQLNNLVSDGKLTASDASALLKDVSKILGDIAFE